MSLARIRLCRVEARHRRYLNAEMSRRLKISRSNRASNPPTFPALQPDPEPRTRSVPLRAPTARSRNLVCSPSDPVKKAIHPAPLLFSENTSEFTVI